jgi:hypothetical protein
MTSTVRQASSERQLLSVANYLPSPPHLPGRNRGQGADANGQREEDRNASAGRWPRSAPCAHFLAERVDANPLGMRPRTQIDDGGETVSIEFLSGRIARIQRRNCSL